MQDCNLVLYSAKYLETGMGATAALWGSNTQGQGTPLCTLSVQGMSAGAAGLAIKDARNKTLWTTVDMALPYSDRVPAGQALAQGSNRYSANGQYFLTVEQDGNLVVCECLLAPCLSQHGRVCSPAEL